MKLSEETKDAVIFFTAMFVIEFVAGYTLLHLSNMEGEYCIFWSWLIGFFGGAAVLGLVKVAKSIFVRE